MRFSDKFSMSLGSLAKRKLRTMLTVMGVMIGVAAIVIMMALGEGMNRQSMEMIEQYGGLRTVEVREGNGQGVQNAAQASQGVSDPTQFKLSDSAIEAIRHMDHVESVNPILEYQAIIQSGAYRLSAYCQAMPLKALKDKNWEFAEGGWPDTGDELQFAFGNMVIQDFEDSRGNMVYWNTGNTVDVDLMSSKLFTIFDTEAYYSSQSGAGGQPGIQETADSSALEPRGASTESPPVNLKKYHISTAGVLAGGMEDYSEYSWSVYCDLDALKSMLEKIFKGRVIPGQPAKKNGKPYGEIFYSRLDVIVDEVENVTEVQNAIGDMGFQASSNSEWIAQAKEQSRSTQAMLGGIGAVSLLVAAIGIANTMMMSIYERTKEIGVMKVLGCGLNDIQQLFLIEAGMIGFLGGMTGLGLSVAVCLIINKVTDAETAVIPLWMFFASVLFAIVVSMLAGFAPSRRAMRLSALEAIRNN